MTQRSDQEGSGVVTPGSPAERLQRLFDLKLDSETGRPYTYAEVARRINAMHYAACSESLVAELTRAGAHPDEIRERTETLSVRPVASGAYIGQLVNGSSSNPTLQVMKYIGEFFGVRPEKIFFAGPSRFDDELELLGRLRDTGVLSLMKNQGVMALARAATPLSPDSMAKAIELVEHIRKLEGGEDRSTIQ